MMVALDPLTADILDRLRNLLAQQSGVDVEKITGGSCLGQTQRPNASDPLAQHQCLGLDSLDLIDTALRVQAEFDIEIPDDDVDRPELGTVLGLAAHIEQKLAGADRSASE